MSAVIEKTRPTLGPMPVIETGNLVLRPHRLSDAEAIAQSLGDFAVVRMLSRVPAPYHRQDALDWLAAVTAPEVSGWHYAVTTGDDVHVGVVAIDLRARHWHLGYWLNRYFWGRGLMSEAAYAVVERFTRRMPDVALASGAFADNAASLRIQAKIGFHIAGAGLLYSQARNAMAPHVDTRLDPGALRAAPGLPRKA